MACSYHGLRGSHERKGTGMSAPFHRARMMFALISAAFELTGAERSLALSKIGDYVSRGKGKHRSKPSSNFYGRCTDFGHRRHGQRECARRVRQMAKGMLPPGERISA